MNKTGPVQEQKRSNAQPKLAEILHQHAAVNPTELVISSSGLREPRNPGQVDFSQVTTQTAIPIKNLSSSPREIQPKLRVNQPGDAYEQEADRIADLVMRTSLPNDRSEKDCEQMGCEEMIHRRENSSKTQLRVPGVVHEVLGSPGQPLDTETRAFMEPRFGQDFSHVRIHTGPKASQSARSIHAHAYTLGKDIVFGEGKYSPDTSNGRHLLAHELTHVVQQEKRSFQVGEHHQVHRQESNTPEEPVSQDPPQRAETSQEGPLPQMSWARGPSFGSPLELPEEEAARRVNEALDLMGPGLTYVRRPPRSSDLVASADEDSESGVVQTYPDGTIQRDGSSASGSSALANIHGGVVGSIQVCWDCLTGEASLIGWIWAGIGYESRFGWFGGYYFGERIWWTGQLGRWFEPGTCDPQCNREAHGRSESGFGIAGFLPRLHPRQRAVLSQAGLEVGFLLTPHSFCDADLELIALLNLLNYLGPVAPILTRAVDGLNRVITPVHVELEAGIDVSATFHLCKSISGLLAVNRANFCAGGFVGAGIGLSHNKTENHGAT